MKINSYLVFALLVILFSYTLAVDISKQETSTDKKAKETADALKVEAKGDEGKYGVNYGGGGGGGGSGWGGGGHGGCSHGCCYRGYGGSCNRCCNSPEEAKAFSENQAETKEATDTPKVEAKGDEEHYGVNYGGGGGGGSGWGGGGGGHGGCSHGCCYRGHGGSCNRCCNSPEEAKANFENQEEQYGLNYGGGGGGGGSGWGGGGHGGCSHGCCYRGYGGSCNRCCNSPEEAKALFENQAEVKGDEEQYGVNAGGGGGGSGWGGGGGGSGWGGGCRHGCCYYGYRGSCNRCCTSLKEAMAFTQAKGDEGKYGVNYGGGGSGGGNHGGGGSGWGGCNHGCCQHGYRGSCNRCCASPEEAKAFAENQSRP